MDNNSYNSKNKTQFLPNGESKQVRTVTAQTNYTNCTPTRTVNKVGQGSIITQNGEDCTLALDLLPILDINQPSFGHSDNGTPSTRTNLNYTVVDLAGNKSDLSTTLQTAIDKDKPLTESEAGSRNTAENRTNTTTGLVGGSQILEVKEVETGSVLTSDITNKTILDTKVIGERNSDLVANLRQRTNLNPNNPSSPTTNNYPYGTSQMDDNWNGGTRFWLGDTKRDDDSALAANCTTISSSPIKNRRLGLCSDGVYTMAHSLVDTAGNSGSVMEKVVERDTVSPGAAVVSLSKVGDILKESIDLWITGEQDTRAKIVIQGSNGTNFNQDITLENGDLKILSIISKLQCGNVTYIAKVTLTDKASNTSRESTSTVTTSDCPSCGTVSSNSPIRDPNSYITARFGVSAGYGSGNTFHYGIDYGNVPVGTPVYPIMAGKVMFVQNNIYQDQVSYPDYNDIRNYGNYIDIDHGNGIKSRYAHLKPNSIAVAAGQTIPATLPIGGLGNTGNSTGAHLHFEIRVNGKAQDPEIFLNNKASFQSTNSNLSLEQQNRYGCQQIVGGSGNDNDPEAQEINLDKLRSILGSNAEAVIKKYLKISIDSEFFVTNINNNNWKTEEDDIHDGVNHLQRKIKLDMVNGTDNDKMLYNGKKQVWIVSHGWYKDVDDAKSYNKNYMKESADVLKIAKTDDIILTLDWREAAASTHWFVGPAQVGRAAKWIKPTAREVANKLKAWGMYDGANLNFVGHSLGTLMSREIASEMGGANNAVLLDPPSQLSSVGCGRTLEWYSGVSAALGTLGTSWYTTSWASGCWGYDLDGNINGDEIPDTNNYYRSQFKFSRSFVGATSVAGNQYLAPTSHESIRVRFEASFNPGKIGSEHFDVISNYNRLQTDNKLSYQLLSTKQLYPQITSSQIGEGFNGELYVVKKDTENRDYTQYLRFRSDTGWDLVGTIGNNEISNEFNSTIPYDGKPVSLYGGAGNDTFQIKIGIRTQIMDFDDSGDRIGLNNFIYDNRVVNGTISQCKINLWFTCALWVGDTTVYGLRANEIINTNSISFPSNVYTVN